MREEHILGIMNQLNSPQDFSKFKMSRGALSSLLIEKGIKMAKRSAGIASAKRETIYRMWKSGQSFLQISRRYRILPLSVAHALRQRLGFNKKEFARMVRCENGEPRGIAVRVEREIKEACRYDHIHAPKALGYMREQGEGGEAIASKILKSKKINFKTEKEQDKKQGNKTPDFLFEKKEKLFGEGVFWLESKATFGRLAEVKGDWNSQLKHYAKLFGPGIVVYWFGYTDEAKDVLEDVFIRSGDDLKKYAQKEIEALERNGLRL